MKCEKCSKEAVVSVGPGRLPLCQEHFEEHMKRLAKEVRRLRKLVQGWDSG